jgi:hypothetical protein
MSVLTRPRTLRRTPVVPAPRPAAHDGGIPGPVGPSQDRVSRRRRAALVLAAFVAAVAAATTTAVVQLTGDDPAPLAPGTERGVAELETIHDEVQLRRELSSDSSRASNAARDAATAAR